MNKKKFLAGVGALVFLANASFVFAQTVAEDENAVVTEEDAVVTTAQPVQQNQNPQQNQNQPGQNQNHDQRQGPDFRDRNRPDYRMQRQRVDITPGRFTPYQIFVRRGGTVVWVNRDRMPHTVTARNGMFDSGRIMPGRMYAKTFYRPGTYYYYCRIHPNMRGMIIVR